MRKWIIPAAAVVVVAAALVARVSQSDARWHILSNTAINTNRLCVDGLRYTWASGETTTQPSATRPVGAPWWIGPVALVVQHAPSTTPSTEQDWFNAPLAGADVFEAAYRPTFNPTDQFWYPYSHVGTVPFRHPLASGTESVRLDPQPMAMTHRQTLSKRSITVSCLAASTSCRGRRQTRSISRSMGR